MRKENINVLSAADNSSQDGIQIDSNQLIAVSFHVVFGDATAAGTVKIQASNDICTYGNVAQEFTVTNWTDIPTDQYPGASAVIASGASAFLSMADFSFRWLRVVYTRSGGGSTTINVNMMASSL